MCGIQPYNSGLIESPATSHSHWTNAAKPAFRIFYPMTATIQPNEDLKPARFELRLSILFAMLFMPNAINLSFFPLWLEYIGLHPIQISTMLSVPVFVRLLTTPIFTYFADRSPERSYVLIAIAAASLGVSALLFLPLGYWSLMVVVVFLAMFWSPQVPIADSIALSGVNRYKIDYPSIRIWGSVMFLALNIFAGYVIERTNPGFAIPMLVLGFALILLTSLQIPRLGKRRRPFAQISAATGNAILKPPVLLMLLTTALLQASHGFVYSFGSIFWQSLGVGAEQVGLLWAVQVFAEIVLFRFYGRLFGKMKLQYVLTAAGLFGIFRWVLFANAEALQLGFYSLAAIQILHAFSFGAVYIAMQNFLAVSVPEEQASAAQGLTVFIHGVAMVITMFSAGPLYAAYHGHGFYVMTLVSAAGIGCAFWFAHAYKKAAQTAYPQSAVVGGDTMEPL